jgi:superfamily II DNA or RNA helicase
MSTQIQLRPHQERGDVAMQQYNKGQLIYPTGGGKTLNMIMDAVRQFQSATPQTIVVVAPRILLAEQLSSEFLEHIVDPMVRCASCSQWRNSSRIYYKSCCRSMIGQFKLTNVIV